MGGHFEDVEVRNELPTRLLRIEIVVVLGVSLGASAVWSVLSIIRKLTDPQVPLNQQTTSLNVSTVPDRPWLDLSYQIANILLPVAPALLVMYLLAISFRRPFAMIGFDARRPLPDLVLGLLVALGIGLPGLGLYLGARALNLNTTVSAANLTEQWWTTPVLIGLAIMNGVLEEVIMLGWWFVRTRELGWGWLWVILGSALVRGSYHLYQGIGGFIGNVVMGVIFGLVFVKCRRVMPLVVAHAVIDIVAFVGYALAAPHLSWLG
ncbi:MAG TPA: CPBP family intramembrane metalloprotease [Candidatus Avipropionibacterium avicola]|uniref:CPBP family intramembrane metalloprotease n=1 Tax=Candidatus Avipropionibacterium avicola TaxID=2840701 RepID=A0A9D1KPH9_9ACTN|nr:CPBP family intramembrane metalloprotease [Candidatus Avipropionibacterium avicola]